MLSARFDPLKMYFVRELGISPSMTAEQPHFTPALQIERLSSFKRHLGWFTQWWGHSEGGTKINKFQSSLPDHIRKWSNSNIMRPRLCWKAILFPFLPTHNGELRSTPKSPLVVCSWHYPTLKARYESSRSYFSLQSASEKLWGKSVGSSIKEFLWAT